MFKQKKPILFKVTVTNGVCLLLQDLLQKLFGRCDFFSSSRGTACLLGNRDSMQKMVMFNDSAR
jgi:hypothetical protein